MKQTATRGTDDKTAVTLLRGDSAGPPAAEGAGIVLAPGATIYQYELIREIGSGGMGTVYLARDTRLGRRVAIKFLHADDAELNQRFILEARTTASCSHENIVVIHEVGEYESTPYMVLEFLQGQSLKKLIGGQRVPAARAVELMVPVVRALACAHAQNIVHRDLKPDNIVVTDSGTIKVLDFGIAKVLQTGEPAAAAAGAARPEAALAAAAGDDTELTRQGAILGTLPYMAPEQWSMSDVDHRADIWAIGIMMFQMLAGRHPLAPLQGIQLVVTKDVRTPMPLLREAAPDVAPELAAVVDRCLRKWKDQRFPDAKSLLRALEPFLPGRAVRDLRVEEAPYAGLSSFQEADADRFFGRSREITAMVNRLHDRPVMAVVGPSGAGKSSFVRAGVVPVLKRSGQAWEAIIIRPGRDPLGALAAMVTPFMISSTTIDDEIQQQRQLVERLRVEPGYVGTVLRSRARKERRNILLFVDQAEELYTQVADPAERLAFTACLASIADDATAPTRVVVSLRSDFLDRMSEDEQFMAEVTQGLFFLAPPQQEGLRDALVQPAEMAGYRFETPELVEKMLQHLQSIQGALPLLQFAATRLWEARDPARKLLTQHAYDEMGGIAGALATHADSVLAALSASEQALARALLLRLVTAERTRAIVSVDELSELSPDGAEVQRLMQHLVQARLLVIQTGGAGSGATVEIVHESLIHSWPMLKRWLDEGQEDVAFLEQLRAAARQWQAKDLDRGLLWGGDMVEEARRFKRRFRGELPALQREFLEAVLANAARAVRLRRSLLATGGAVLVLMVAASAVALVVIRGAQRRAEEQAQVAQREKTEADKARSEAVKNMLAAQEEEKERRAAQARAEEERLKTEIANAGLVKAQRVATYQAQLARLEASRAKAAQEEEAKAKTRLQLKLDKEEEYNRRMGLIRELPTAGGKR
ncbi:MAG TPA: protein kinase [Myxococcales bacterium]|nr:protein kinase [Myxococcales bacterium]